MNRCLAHIILEAKTPLKVGGNKSDLFYDAPVQKDFNGLPMILGTSIAGVLRAKFESKFTEQKSNDIFGSQDGGGSKIIFSNALLLDENEKVAENLLVEKGKFLSIFENLPIRQHTAINCKGVAKENSKFDEEIVFKGTRFKFSLEFDGCLDDFLEILKILKDKSLRFGAGGSKGFGELEIKSIKYAKMELCEYSSSLNFDFDGKIFNQDCDESGFDEYKLRLKADDFFLFGSGFGDEDCDQTPVFEQIVDYRNAKLSSKKILIPASSIKGAISHRTAFYYNKLNPKHKKVGEENEAVKVIFGCKKDENGVGQKGRVLISDCFVNFKDEKAVTKVFDHVSIDRFTGGAIDGALFQEKTIILKALEQQNHDFEIKILLKKGDVENDIITAFESAILDITNGLLPLGGATTKGHGFFAGIILKNGEELKNEKK